MRYVFKSWKAFWHSSVHSNAFLRTLKNDKHLSVALETNLLRAATRPVRDWTSLMLYGGFIFRIVLIFSGFASIPLCDTMNPRNFPDDTPNTHLLGFNFILNRLSVSKVSCKSSRCSSSSRFLPTCHPHKLLHFVWSEGRTCGWQVIGMLPQQAKGHYFVTKQALTSNKWCLLLIRSVHPYLIISRKSIHKTKQFMTRSGIHQLINTRQWIAILGVGLV